MPSAPAGGNTEDRFSDAFSGALSTGAEPSQASPEPAAAEPSVDHAPPVGDAPVGDAPAGEQPAAAQTTEAPAEIDPYADEDPGDQAAIEAFLTTPRGREVYAGYKFASELAKPSGQGGIGHAPSVQDVRTYFTAHQNNVAMYQDYSSGDPQRMGRFLNHWFGADNNGQPKPAAMAALAQLYPVLENAGPEALGQIASPILNRYEAALVGKWQTAQDPKLKAALYQAAQIVHNDLTGDWLPQEAFLDRAAPQPAANPGEQRLQQGWQQLNAERQQLSQQRTQQWDGVRQQAEERTLAGQVDAALKPLTEMKIKQPVVYESLKARLLAEVKTAIQADPQIWNLYQAKVEAARRTGNPAAIEQVTKELLNLAIPVIRGKRAEVLRGAGVVIRQNNADRHQQLREVASHVAPGNTGIPAKQSLVPASLQQKGESRDDYRQRRMSEALAMG